MYSVFIRIIYFWVRLVLKIECINNKYSRYKREFFCYEINKKLKYISYFIFFMVLD